MAGITGHAESARSTAAYIRQLPSKSLSFLKTIPSQVNASMYKYNVIYITMWRD